MENNLLKVEQKETLTSLELLEQINFFRGEIESKKPLAHKTLMRTIRDEFEEEIGRNKIVQSYYINSQNKEQPMFELTLSQAKQVLVRESKAVRKAVIRYIEELEDKLNKPQLDERTIAVMGIMNSNSDLEKALAIKDFEKVVTIPLLEKIEEDKPMVALAEVRLDKGKSVSITDVTKSLGLKRGQITKWAKSKGYIHKSNKNEVNKKGEKYFKVYEYKGFRCVGVLEEGLQLINKHIKEIKEIK